jgi:hypothetical protein
MDMKFRLSGGAIALGLALAAGAANAARVSEQITVIASAFTDIGGSMLTPPTDPATVNFDITYDPAVLYLQTYAGVALVSANVTSTAPLSFENNPLVGINGGPIGLFTDLLVGSYQPGPVFSGDDFDFELIFPVGGGAPSVLQFRYLTSAPFGEFFTKTGTATVTPLPGVPEPATWTMMLVGLGGLGCALRHRGTRTIPAAA